MKNLRFICAQPATDFYAWQVEVMINNFIKNGINPNNIEIVSAIPEAGIPLSWQKLAGHYNSVRFFFYKDTRVNPIYISSIRPNILKQHFSKFPELSQEAIFYHDCDIVLTKQPQWDHLLDDDIWYLSDTRYYISAEYIKSKKFGVYERMCEIIGIDESIPAENELNSGGAQYLMKNVTAEFWEKVENDSESLYRFFLAHLEAFPESPKYHPIQKWTADMWAVLWNGWYFKHTIKVVPELEFAWPMHGLDMWEKCTIFHNAGVIPDPLTKEKMFFKGDYINGIYPYFRIKESDYSQTLCTGKYVKEICETEKVTCLVEQPKNERPITGRSKSFNAVLDIIELYTRPITIVETGSIRNTTEESKYGDGWSTVIWNYYCTKTRSKVHVVDINPTHLEAAKKVVPPSDNVIYYEDDSIHFLQNFDQKIDLLFLDSYDYVGDEENIRKCHEHQLNEVKAAWDKLSPHCFILIDDIFNENWDGKGKLSIPYLIANGFTLVFHNDSQVLLAR